MATWAPAQACRLLRVPRHPSAPLRCISSTARNPAHKPAPLAAARRPPRYEPRPDARDHHHAPKKGGGKKSLIIPKVLRWAHEHNVGFSAELKTHPLRSPGAGALQFRFAPRQTFRSYHMPQYFMGDEHALTEYQLYMYEQKLAEPLWLHLTGSYSVKPVVRNFSRRRMRQAIHQALAERGYAPDGRVVEDPGAEAAGTQGKRERRPKRALRGTIFANVADPVFIVNFSREECLEIGREIVRLVESRQLVR